MGKLNFEGKFLKIDEKSLSLIIKLIKILGIFKNLQFKLFGNSKKNDFSYQSFLF